MKYRIWHHQFKRFLTYEEWFVTQNGGVCYIDHGPNFVEIVPDISGQTEVTVATGITDRNGDEIYCGDIVDFHFKKNFCTIIITMLIKQEQGKFYGYRDRTKYDLFPNKHLLKIIGNKFENPDLYQE
jgi:hypothetical protein